MRSFRLDRRAMLRGAGGIAVGLPFLEIMTSATRTHAEASTPPKRMIVFFSSCGTIYPAWIPTGAEDSFQLSRILAPLAPNQQNLVVLEGISNQVSMHGLGDDHMRGMGGMLTGVELLPGTNQGGSGDPAGLAGGISVDQAIANEVGKQTKFKSLELGIQALRAGTVQGYTSYAAADQPLPADNNPGSVFNRIFSQLGSNSPDLMRIQAERKSVLDAVIESYSRLSPKLGSADKSKLDMHLASIRDLESRLSAPGGATGMKCVKPAAPTIDFQLNDNFPIVGKLQTDLMVMAMACDLTRVGTLQWEAAAGEVVYRWVDPSIDRGHHIMSHDSDTEAVTMEQLIKINIWIASQFNYLLDSLKAIPEGTGSMLDNTLVIWCNELSKGNIHSHEPMCSVLAGKSGGALRTGRFLRFDKTSHNNLLVSLMNLMGLPATTFGNPMYCTGALAGL